MAAAVPVDPPAVLVLAAASFAAEKHRSQRRKGPDAAPYINHPIGVAHSLASEGTVEDTDTTEEELRARFGPAIASTVMEVTDDKSLPKAERKRLQISHAPSMSLAARQVKLADKLYNLRDLLRPGGTPQGWSVARIQGYFVWARAVVAGLDGTNPALECLLKGIFETGEITLDGKTHPAVPKGVDLDAFLEEYIRGL